MLLLSVKYSSIYFLRLQECIIRRGFIMNQTLFIISLVLGCLLFVALGFIFFISRKSQRVMESLLEFMTAPERAKIADATRVLQSLLQDEINKIDDNFKSLSAALSTQIQRSEQIKNDLTVQNDNLVALADEATKKIATMAQRLENTTDDLQTVVNSSAWQAVQHTTDDFSAGLETLLNKIDETTKTTTDKATQINEQINTCITNEKQISEQLQASFDANNTGMNTVTESAHKLQQQLHYPFSFLSYVR